ncbi:MAG: SCO family protein [Verrucomicrobiota bacterium]
MLTKFLVPQRRNENSPAFQRWVDRDKSLSPAGTEEILPSLRDSIFPSPNPALKRWAIFKNPCGIKDAFNRCLSFLRFATALALQIIFFTAICSAATNSSLSEESLLQIKFNQKLESQISINLVFRDESGKEVSLTNYFHHKPVILVMGYYGCPMLCTLVLNGLIESLQDLKQDAGNQFEFVEVSIDPNEKPPLAAAKKRTYLKRYGRAHAESGWHFLTGDEPAIRQLAQEVGFHYAYDARIKEFAHPSGIIVLTPEGKVSSYLFGINYPARELDAALKTAAVKKTGSRIEQLLLLCFHYSPTTSKYGNVVMIAVRVAGIATLGLIGFALFRKTKSKPALERK